MKTQILKYALIAVFGVLLLGCTKDFKKINTNPNASADAPITNVLAYCIRYTCSTYFDAWADMNEPSTYGGHLARNNILMKPVMFSVPEWYRTIGIICISRSIM